MDGLWPSKCLLPSTERHQGLHVELSTHNADSIAGLGDIFSRIAMEKQEERVPI